MANTSDYIQLITSEHINRPDFVQLVGILVGPSVDSLNLLAEMPLAFDLDYAIGVQLDAVGLWAGIGRTVTVQPSTAYPAAAPYVYTFGDDDYRRLIRAKVLANRWDDTPEMAAEVLAAYFGPRGAYAAILDRQDMSIDLLIAGHRPTAAEAAVFAQMLLPLKPTGVRINSGIVPPVDGPLFGLDVANEFINGPDIGAFGDDFL